MLFLASCFAGWRAFAVMVLVYGATLCLIHSFQLGNVPYRLQPKRRFRAASFELSCGHGWSGPLVFFMLTFGILYLKEPLSAGILDGRYLLRGTL
ncbi:hypothetical protein O5698_00570 [Escherichia coli]|nr:hypothetical protein [Escherichia coli]